METTIEQNTKIRPRYFFISLGVVISFFTLTISFINLIFETLNKAYPDTLNAVYQYGYNLWNYDGVRTALSVVIIFFPIFIFLSRVWRKETHLSRNDQILRKWFLYFILFFVVIVSAIDLVTLIRYFVSGEITTRFILKVLSVLFVAGLSYWYYFLELKRDLSSQAKKKNYFALIATLCVLIGIVYSFKIIGTPNTQRALRFDQKRLEDLQNIQNQIVTYWQQKQKLPESLENLIDPLASWQSLPKDPEFQKGVNYEYKKNSDKSFDLCATFKKPIPEGWQENLGYPGVMYQKDSAVSSTLGYGGFQNESWKHDAGYTCFKRTVDADRYPPFNPEPKAL